MESLGKGLFYAVLGFGMMLGAQSCTEVRTLVSVVFDGATSLSTSAFEIEEIKSGNRVTCSVLGDKSVRCVGAGTRGSLGRFFGSPATAFKEVKQIGLGRGFTCLIVGEKSEVYCFGRNDLGQLGVKALPNGALASGDPIQIMDEEGSRGPLVEAKSLAVGESHACALLKGGRAVCWGDNSLGQAGNPAINRVGVKTILENERNPKPFAGITDIYAGANSTCIIAKDDAAVFCFGEKYGSTKKVNWAPEKIDIAGSIGTLSNAKQIGLGRGFGCALIKSSQVYCWGRNELNQLGAMVSLPGMTKASLVKVSFPQEQAISRVDAIAVGEAHTCALHRDESTLYCWGDNRYGQLGNTSVRGLPEQVALGSNNLTLKGVRKVAVGPDRTCIISSRDEVFCWGNGAHGILGSPKVMSPYPVRSLDANGEFLAGAQQISIGTDHTCMIDTSNQVYCFGLNEFGQLGSKVVSGPVIGGDFKPVDKVSAIDTYGVRTCMIYGSDQSIACFGGREIDNLNQKVENNSFVPEEIKRGMSAYRGLLGLAAGRGHVCVVTAEQSVECLGDGAKGQLGAGDTQSAKFGVVQTENGAPIKDIWQLKATEEWTCGLKQESGEIYCWGSWKGLQWMQAKRILFQGKPSQDFIQIALTENQICGVHGVDRVVYCTQNGPKGDQVDLLPLFEFDGRPLKKILTISGGKRHFCGLDDEGRLFCWGANESGQLGITSVRETPKAMRIEFKSERLKKLSRVSAGERHTCVSTSEEAALFCFGEDFFGGPPQSDPIEYPL